ncbi:MAG TPA: TauD/TfdA family dioxygenase [Acidimicrobiales bacterium]|nr:TauD/TfdA family dioxygenase [Acidimicrobiales bacterium]
MSIDTPTATDADAGAGARYHRITVEELTPTIGAFVHGVDLAALDDATWEEIAAAFARHLVLFFRGQPISAEAQMALGRRLGDLHLHPAAPSLRDHPEVMIIHADERSKVVAGNGWHTDVSCDERPPMATILRMETVPPSGGDTLFASMYAAYERLSEPMKAFLAGLTAKHESRHVYAGRYGTDESQSRDGTFPSAVHPVIRTHPATGRKALYVNRAFTTRIRELSPGESRALLDFLFAHQENVEFQCRFRWEPDSIAMWDNRCAQHFAVWDYFPNVRHGYRVSVVGERPA